MFNNLLGSIFNAAKGLLADRTIPIPQAAINTALLGMVESIPELTALSVEIHDGSFDLIAEGKKMLTFKSRTKFEITSCVISAEKQIISFKRISPTDLESDGLLDRILIMVFKTLLCGIFQIEPAKLMLEGQPGITIHDDNYIVDLSQTAVSKQITPKIEGVLNAVCSIVQVKELQCATETINALVGIIE